MSISKVIVFTFILIFLISIDITNAARKVPLDKKKLDDDATLIDTQGVGGCNPISRCRGIGIKDEIIRDIKRRGRTKRKSPPKA